MAEAQTPQKPEGAEELERQGIQGIISALHTSTNPEVRAYAAYLLGKGKNPVVIQPLIMALADNNKSVREQAMLALVELGRSAVEPLAATMKDEKWVTRYRAAEALGKIADEKAVQPLVQGLKDNRDHVRYMAAKGLQVLGDSEALVPMIILLNDQNRFVRLMAVRALSAIGGKSAHEALAHALEIETDAQVREAITEAIK
jgi:HEAT repeat protein